MILLPQTWRIEGRVAQREKGFIKVLGKLGNIVAETLSFLSMFAHLEKIQKHFCCENNVSQSAHMFSNVSSTRDIVFAQYVLRFPSLSTLGIMTKHQQGTMFPNLPRVPPANKIISILLPSVLQTAILQWFVNPHCFRHTFYCVWVFSWMPDDGFITHIYRTYLYAPSGEVNEN